MKDQDRKRRIVAICLGFILCIGVFVRFFQLSTNPPGVSSDEADIGYAAYSLMQTGKTQYNDPNGLVFHEFNGGLFPSGYSYVLMPFIQVFGLSVHTERLPSALTSTMSILLMYILAYIFFGNPWYAAGTAFLFSVNPWSLLYARQGRFESIGIFAFMCGIVLILLSKKHTYYAVAGAVMFGLSMLVNDATKIVAPLVLPAILWYGYARKRVSFRTMRSIAVIFSVFLLFCAIALFVNGQIGDLNRSGKYNAADVVRQVDAERTHSLAPLWASKLFHNKATVLWKLYITDYFKIFSANWFFIEGHWNLQESMGRHGQYLLFELPLFFIGAYVIAKKYRREGLVLLWWLLVANLPGAITKGDYFPYRSILMLPVPLFASGIGLWEVWIWFNRFPRVAAVCGRAILVTVIVAGISSMLFTHFFDYPVYASEWRFKERTDMFRYAITAEKRYPSVFVSGGAEQATTVAFLTGMSPLEFQRAKARPVIYKEIPFVKLENLYIGDFDERKVADPQSFFPRGSIVFVDGNQYASQSAVMSFTAAVEPLRTVYKAFEVQ